MRAITHTHTHGEEESAHGVFPSNALIITGETNKRRRRRRRAPSNWNESLKGFNVRASRCVWAKRYLYMYTRRKGSPAVIIVAIIESRREEYRIWWYLGCCRKFPFIVHQSSTNTRKFLFYFFSLFYFLFHLPKGEIPHSHLLLLMKHFELLQQNDEKKTRKKRRNNKGKKRERKKERDG